MCQAVLCPVCNGAGKLMLSDPSYLGSVSEVYATCHGCKGLGWVTVLCFREADVQVIYSVTPAEPIPEGENTTGDGRED